MLRWELNLKKLVEMEERDIADREEALKKLAEMEEGEISYREDACYIFSSLGVFAARVYLGSLYLEVFCWFCMLWDFGI